MRSSYFSSGWSPRSRCPLVLVAPVIPCLPCLLSDQRLTHSRRWFYSSWWSRYVRCPRTPWHLCRSSIGGFFIFFQVAILPRVAVFKSTPFSCFFFSSFELRISGWSSHGGRSYIDHTARSSSQSLRSVSKRPNTHGIHHSNHVGLYFSFSCMRF